MRLVVALLVLGIGACARPSQSSGNAATSAPSVPESRGAHEGSSRSYEPALVAGSVYVLSAAGGNVVISRGDDGLVVVDPRVPEIEGALEAFAPRAARTVIDTHSHRDHTSGNGVVVRAPGVIIAHERVKARLAEPQVFKGHRVPAAPETDWPTRSYSDHMQIRANGEDIELVHPAGAHTDGDTVVIFTKARVVAMGDVFFVDRFPYVDPDGGGRVDALVAAIDDFVRTWPEDMRIVPGHGRSVCSMTDLRAYQGMLHESLAWIGAGKAAGLSMDGLVARGAPAAYKGWAWPLVDEQLWVSLVANSGGV